MSTLAHSYCVFRVGGAILALDTVLVGEVATLEAVTRLPGCARAVRGVAHLRGRSIAVIDLGAVFELAPVAALPRTAGELLTVVLRLPGCECGLLVNAVDGVLIADPSGRRGVNRAAEPAWIAAFQAFAIAGAPTLTAAVIDAGELALRLERLRPARLTTAAA
jgi:chemotaxis signal transduction protein